MSLQRIMPNIEVSEDSRLDFSDALMIAARIRRDAARLRELYSSIISREGENDNIQKFKDMKIDIDAAFVACENIAFELPIAAGLVEEDRV